MLTDIHYHPFDLNGVYPEHEEERRKIGVIAAASACDTEEFNYNEKLSQDAEKAEAAPLLSCFGIHPQIFKIRNNISVNDNELLETLCSLASEKRIKAIGECGFDLYNSAFKETEKQQDLTFASHLEIAIRYNLPIILHVRRAMFKIFELTNILKKCKVVVFHSWSGTYEEGLALLRRGVNSYFSFGNTIMLNHKQAMKCCALFPAERLLTETDAPYQPHRGESYSRWSDLPLIIEAAAALRSEAGNKTSVIEMEKQVESNFKWIF